MAFTGTVVKQMEINNRGLLHCIPHVAHPLKEKFPWCAEQHRLEAALKPFFRGVPSTNALIVCMPYGDACCKRKSKKRNFVKVYFMTIYYVCPWTHLLRPSVKVLQFAVVKYTTAPPHWGHSGKIGGAAYPLDQSVLRLTCSVLSPVPCHHIVAYTVDMLNIIPLYPGTQF